MTEPGSHMSTTRVSGGPGYLVSQVLQPDTAMLSPLTAQWTSPLYESDLQNSVHFRSLGTPLGPRSSMELIMEIS